MHKRHDITNKLLLKMADSDDDSVTSGESVDSDTQLRRAFSRGELKPGLLVPARAPRRHVNNTEGMKDKVDTFKKSLDWIERMEITVTAKDSEEGADENSDDINDDFKRELKFYHQAQAAVLQALPKLHKLKLPTKRPEDYFAEMAKTDDHMRKVRQKLLSKQLSIERSEKAKKLRELRKYGKKVQREVLQKRRKEKKELLESVKKFRKGQRDKLDFADDTNIMPPNEFKGKAKKGGKPMMSTKSKPQVNPKRLFKNKKFGHGGPKKRSKYNTAESSADMSQFRFRKAGGKQKGGGKKRLGKSRRQKPRVKARR
ncbi:probable rRNA-processing protein EBP2 [Ptychodera flava]|uniref:probable rRNA-processing protein EBP2 n=1 Tax=Ptychodera flava TaxID=63121 RepID=UPI00396A4929